MHTQFEQNKAFSRQLDEHSSILQNISKQLESLNSDISSLQTRLTSTETYVSNMSHTQSTLINSVHLSVSSCFLLFLYFRFSQYLKCPINSGKIYKKSADRKILESPSGDQRGATRDTGALVARPRVGPRRWPASTPWSTTWLPFSLY